VVLLHRVLSDRFLSDREFHYNLGWISIGEPTGFGLWDSPYLIWGLNTLISRLYWNAYTLWHAR
jgi:hypothetical protein